MWVGIGVRWVVRIISVFFCLIAALMHAYDLPLLNWLWDATIAGFLPWLIPIAGFFFLSWIWPGGK